MYVPHCYVIPRCSWFIATPHYDAAQGVLNQLRSRTKPEDVLVHLDTLKNNLSETADVSEDPDTVVRAIAIQSLLHIGARSFSHFLNAVERYLIVLRALTGSPEAKIHVLELVSSFWQRSRQMVGIVFDKLMQYQIVEPADVVAWVFARNAGGLNWDLLRSAVDKANGRVVVASRRVATLRKEDDDAHARAKANANGGAEVAAMEVDPETMHGTYADDVKQLWCLRLVLRSTSNAGRGLSAAGVGAQSTCGSDEGAKIDASARLGRFYSCPSLVVRHSTTRYHGGRVGCTCELGRRRMGGLANMDVVQTLLPSGMNNIFSDEGVG